MSQEILEAIADKNATRRDVARLYAKLLPVHGGEAADADFPAINCAIMERWSKGGLISVKELAWRIALNPAIASAAPAG